MIESNLNQRNLKLENEGRQGRKIRRFRHKHSLVAAVAAAGVDEPAANHPPQASTATAASSRVFIPAQIVKLEQACITSKRQDYERNDGWQSETEWELSFGQSLDHCVDCFLADVVSLDRDPTLGELSPVRTRVGCACEKCGGTNCVPRGHGRGLWTQLNMRQGRKHHSKSSKNEVDASAQQLHARITHGTTRG